VRFSLTLVFSTVYMWYTKVPDFPLGKPEIRWMLVLRGFGGFFGVFGFYCKLFLYDKHLVLLWWERLKLVEFHTSFATQVP